MTDPFHNEQPKKTLELTPDEAKAQGIELTDEELAQTSGGYGHRYHYRRWHYDRRWENGREIVIVVVDEY